jgi:hypothetical protein
MYVLLLNDRVYGFTIKEKAISFIKEHNTSEDLLVYLNTDEYKYVIVMDKQFIAADLVFNTHSEACQYLDKASLPSSISFDIYEINNVR